MGADWKIDTIKPVNVAYPNPRLDCLHRMLDYRNHSFFEMGLV